MAEQPTMQELMKTINKTYNADILHLGLPEYDYKRIPFTSPRMNYITYGGIPRGKLVEFYGEQHGGKTTSSLDIVTNYQRLPDAKGIVYADLENTLDRVWATKLGVNFDIPLGEPGCVYLMNPTNQGSETIFDMLIDMIKTGEIGLIVIDSLGVMLSDLAYTKKIGEKTYGGIGMSLTNFSKQAEGLCNKYDCTIVGINQMRDDLNNPYGGQTTTGGRAWRHNASVRLEFRRGSYFDEKYKKLGQKAEGNIGNFVEVYMSKNKTCPPDRHVGFYTIKYDTGVDYLYDLIDICIMLKIIQQRGAYFDLFDNETGEVLKTIQGMSKLYDFLLEPENEPTLASLEKAVEVAINGD